MIARLLLLAIITAWPSAGTGAEPANQAVTLETAKGFEELVDSLKAAVQANDMVVVTQACASCGAARRGITIRGNMVLGVYRNDFAVRMLAASVPAGIEAPIRFYVTEDEDGTASLTYRMPSAVFAPYGAPTSTPWPPSSIRSGKGSSTIRSRSSGRARPRFPPQGA